MRELVGNPKIKKTLLLIATTLAMTIAYQALTDDNKKIQKDVVAEETQIKKQFQTRGKWNVSMVQENQDLKKAVDYHLDRIGVEKTPLAYQKTSILLNSIAFFESDFNTNAKNPNSTASGLYQYVDAAKETAVNRVNNLKNAGVNLSESLMDKMKSIGTGEFDFDSLSSNDVSTLAFIDNMQRKGTDEAWKKILMSSDVSNIVKGIGDFYQSHHTNVNQENGSLENITKKSRHVVFHLLHIEKVREKLISKINENIDRISPLSSKHLSSHSSDVSFDMYLDKYITKKVFISLLMDIGSDKALLLVSAISPMKLQKSIKSVKEKSKSNTANQTHTHQSSIFPRIS